VPKLANVMNEVSAKVLVNETMTTTWMKQLLFTNCTIFSEVNIVAFAYQNRF